MNIITEQVKYLRNFGCFGTVKQAMDDAADTIETLSAKLAAANMERSEWYYGMKYIEAEEEVLRELIEQHDEAFDLILRMPLVGNEVWHGYVSGVMQTLGFLIDNIKDNKEKRNNLIKAEVLKDDDLKYVVGFSDRFEVDKKTPRVEVVIREVEE